MNNSKNNPLENINTDNLKDFSNSINPNTINNIKDLVNKRKSF